MGLDKIIWFQVFYVIQIIWTYFYGFNYSCLIWKIKGFQAVFLLDNKYSFEISYIVLSN